MGAGVGLAISSGAASIMASDARNYNLGQLGALGSGGYGNELMQRAFEATLMGGSRDYPLPSELSANDRATFGVPNLCDQPVG